jgi:hypothetical protein
MPIHRELTPPCSFTQGQDVIRQPLDNDLETEFNLGYDDSNADSRDNEEEDENEDYKVIKQKLLKNKEIVSIQSTKYIYIGKDTGWNILTSSLASKTICDIGDLYAPVNFVIAAEPIISNLQYCSTPIVALPLTITQGDIRCSFVTNLDSKEAPLTITRGKIHEYLGMTLDYSEPGKVKIGMMDYIDTMLEELPPDMQVGEAPTPALEAPIHDK